MEKDLFIYLMMNVPKKQIRFRPVLQKFFPKQRFHFLRMSIFLSTANYTNLQKGIHETTEYLEAFLRNLLLNEKNELHNRNLHISVLSEKGSDFSVKTTVYIQRFFEKFGFDEVFGRSAVMELLELKASGAAKLLFCL